MIIKKEEDYCKRVLMMEKDEIIGFNHNFYINFNKKKGDKND